MEHYFVEENSNAFKEDFKALIEIALETFGDINCDFSISIINGKSPILIYCSNVEENDFFAFSDIAVSLCKEHKLDYFTIFKSKGYKNIIFWGSKEEKRVIDSSNFIL